MSSDEPFSPGKPPDWRGSARWCGRDWAGGGGGARGDRSGMVCSDPFGVTTRGSPRGCPILPLWMFPSPSPAPSACGWPPTAGPMTRGRGRGRPPAGSRAVLLLRWMVAGTALTTLARDSKVSRATAYRYLHEALGVIADRAPDLPEVLDRLRRSKEPNAGLDGTLIRTDRVVPAQPRHGPPPVVLGQGEGVRGRRAGGDGFSPGSRCTRVRWSPAPPTT